MNYAVFCTAAADGELAAIWIASDDRKGISAAAYDIEQALADAPLDHGESRDDNLRIIFVTPLGARSKKVTVTIFMLGAATPIGVAKMATVTFLLGDLGEGGPQDRQLQPPRGELS